MQEENGIVQTLGEPTESAIVMRGYDDNINKNLLDMNFPRVKEIPFDSARKLMTTIHKMETGYRIITKGAPDVLLTKCNKDYNNGNIKELNNIRIEQIKKENKAMAEKALRVLAVAYQDINAMPNNMDPNRIENNLVFVRTYRNDRSSTRRCKRSGKNM